MVGMEERSKVRVFAEASKSLFLKSGSLFLKSGSLFLLHVNSYDRYEATTETVANRCHVPQTTTSLFLLLPLSVVVVAVKLKLREVAIERDGD
ncbi:hypothetical protein F2Q69_00027754 [Brassica cretica]|uniref:Uncharacterized protein n=1 Tax=Brassica cretica TaxID=69181 RepID=A0A8S9RYW6_BRACR|nr:hypothetical protein F2Q69_00027754 [Brassica cretica]